MEPLYLTGIINKKMNGMVVMMKTSIYKKQQQKSVALQFMLKKHPLRTKKETTTANNKNKNKITKQIIYPCDEY